VPAAPGGWSATVAQQSTGSTNLLGLSGNSVALSNFVLVPGAQVPSNPRSQLIVRPTTEEIALCGRYYEKTYELAVIPGTANAYGYETSWNAGSVVLNTLQSFRYRHKKRLAPAITIWALDGTANVVYDAGRAINVATTNLDGINENSFRLAANVQTGLYFQWVADARF
jgi:hypothetical protein